MCPYKYKCSGLTLIELMVTIAILAIVAAIAIPAYNGYVRTSRISECLNEIAAIKISQEEFFLANNTYFAGGSAAALQAASGNIYQPSPEALGITRPPNCSYVVGAGSTGTIATSYSVTATGINDLAVEGVVATTGN